MAELPLPGEAQLLARIRDLEDEVARLRAQGSAAAAPLPRDARLLESEERFRVAFTTTPASLSIARATDGRLLFVNPKFCENSGYAEEEIVGQTFESLGIYADEAQRQRIFELIIATGRVENEPFRYRRRGGELRHGLLSSRPIVLGGEVCQLGVMVDVTATHRAEAERRRVEEELRQAQKMEAIGRLAGGVAHDFNNMLTAILAHAEIGRLDPHLGKGRVHFDEIAEAARRAAQLTGQLLAFSRKQVLEPRPVSLGALVERLGSMLRRLVPEDVALDVHLAEGLPAVRADPSQLEQVVLNLVVNARDAVGAQGHITVTGHEVDLARGAHAGRFVALTIADDGVGMSQELLSHVFEPFFSTKGERGTGLGLSTVDGIVTQHGGFVEVESAPGRGTRFCVFWPVSVDPHEAVSAPATSADVAARGGSILLVEDDASVREPTHRLLERLGYSVSACASSADALAELRRVPWDVLLTDLVMPGTSGHVLARTTRALRPTTAVVTMSGYPEDILERGGVLEPDVVLLRKPFGAERLVEAIERARRLTAAQSLTGT